MKITSDNLKIISSYLKDKLIDSFINNIFLLNNKDIVFSFSFYREKKLLISLSTQEPFISLVNKELTSPTILNKTNEFLRKYIKNSEIKDITTFNNDRILDFSLEKRDEYYQKEHLTLRLELIPKRSNLIILNDKNIILFALVTTSFDAKRKIVVNMPYEPLENENVFNCDANFSIEELEDYANSYIATSFKVRKKEKYQSLITHIKGKVNSLKRKIKDLESEQRKFIKALEYKDIADTIYTLASEDDKTQLEEYILTIPNYDKSLSYFENAQNYYKKYKKAKRGIEMISTQLEITKKALEEKTIIYNCLPYTSEEELNELNQQYLKKPKKGKPTPFYIPSYITFENIKIGFGKSVTQNDYLTFKLAKPDYTFLHIKDYSGAHVVIFLNNPSNSCLQLAAEICLLLSSKEAGDIYYTKIKNVKKTKETGKVNLLEYKEITIHKIDDKTKELLLDNKRFIS